MARREMSPLEYARQQSQLRSLEEAKALARDAVNANTEVMAMCQAMREETLLRNGYGANARARKYDVLRVKVETTYENLSKARLPCSSKEVFKVLKEQYPKDDFKISSIANWIKPLRKKKKPKTT